MQGQIRRSQLITTYGVGSIVAVEDESFMVAGVDRWPVRAATLHEPRLERALGVSGFVLPPASEAGQDIPVVRFPRWVWCPCCKRIDKHGFFTSPSKNKCGQCGVTLVPSRFVACCANGHIADFPYFRWIHARSKGQGSDHVMRMEMGGTTASLRDIRLSCSCGAEATMERAFAKEALNGIMKCEGSRPWLVNDDGPCDQVPRTLQRGASNVWFAITHSAISIPPWSEGAYKVLNRQWMTLQHIPDEALAPTIRGMKLAEGTSFSVDDLVDAIRQRKADVAADVHPLKDRIKQQEYDALCRGRKETDRDQDFAAVPAKTMSGAAAAWFGQVMLVTRLREVRALQSFSRVKPPGVTDVVARPAIFDSDPGWLPAIEVVGEGVFLRLNDERLKEWECRDPVIARVSKLDVHYRKRCEARKQVPDRQITPRLVLVHSLAHALINQWALDCGYPAAALRERLYVGDEMAGILIFTATSDSAGSLGGIISQAEPDRLDESLRQAAATSGWCSADPLCIEAESAGSDSLNLAACHACLLLPEVSCEEMNLILDRGVLIGVPGTPEIGFLNGLLPRS